MSDFGGTARSLAKNPIGIVALFLVLIYGFATLLFGAAGGAFTEAQRWPFIWFLILFPVLILTAFLFLVVFHHEKLYAPSEYRDEKHFFRKLSPEVQKSRLDEKIESLEKASHANVTNSKDAYRPLDRAEIRLEVSLAEDLSMRALEEELGCSISREVGVRAGNGWLNLDGAVARDNELVAIEVKHFRVGFPYFQIEHLLNLLTTMKFERFERVSLILAIVSEASENADKELEAELNKKISTFSIPVRLRMFRFDTLKARFGLSS